MNKFQKLVARIERSNKTFKNASPAKKIVMVAQDVLGLLDLKRISPIKGYYVDLYDDDRLSKFKDLSEYLKLPRIPACRVCAIGAGMVAATIRLNNVPASDTYIAFWDNENAMSNQTMSVFPIPLLRSMEGAFEHQFYGYEQNNEGRLRAIYENLIENKGKKFTEYHTGKVVWKA